MKKLYFSLIISALAVSSAFAQMAGAPYATQIRNKEIKNAPHRGSRTMASGDSLNNYLEFISLREKDVSQGYPYYTKWDLNASYIVPNDVLGNYAGGWNGSFIPSYAYLGGTTGDTYDFDNHYLFYKASCTAGCTGTPTSRWYQYFDAKDTWVKNHASPVNSDSSNFAYNYLARDTTILVRYGTTYDGPWIHALGNVLDVASPYFNNNVSYPLATSLHMDATSTFTLDSIDIPFFYFRKDPDASLVDTLLVEVAINPGASLQLSLFKANAVTTNLGVDSVIWADLPYDTLTNTLNLSTKVQYKLPLTQADHDAAIANNHLMEYAFKPTPNAVTAGQPVVVTWAFISGVSPFLKVSETAGNELKLSQNEPNPFRSTSTINYELKNAGQVNFVVTDLTGRVVMERNEGMQTAGKHNIALNSGDFAKGVYFYTLKSAGASLTKKMIVLQ